MKKVLDSWAVLAWLQNEKPACDQVQYLLNLAETGKIELLMNFINVGEVYYRLIRLKNECPVLTGDPEFQSVSSLVDIEWLKRQDGGG